MSNTPASTGSSSSGLLVGARNSAATLLSTGRTRLLLLGNELKEEKLRAVRLLLLSQMVAFCLAVGTILLIGLLVVTFWESRAIVLASAAAAFIACSGFAYAALKRAIQRPDPVFAASLAELAEDVRQLKRAARDEPRTD